MRGERRKPGQTYLAAIGWRERVILGGCTRGSHIGTLMEFSRLSRNVRLKNVTVRRNVPGSWSRKLISLGTNISSEAVSTTL